MTRFLVLTLLTLIALIILAVALNAPRVAEAQAHTAAATAMQAQANVTGLAVFGMTCLAGTLGLVVIAGLGLFGWLTVSGYWPTRGRVQPMPHLRPRSGPRRMRLSATAFSQTADIVPVAPQPPVTYTYPEEIEIVPFTIPPGWEDGECPDVFWTDQSR
ncbi:MAG: hypothetical protein IPL78_35570 [Chloroflexi bacterium]|nr:hypothetical protein [Chloroflexota bacterium]